MAVEKKPVKIMETVLRDAHQSLIATRMTTEQMLPIIDKMDKVGYHAVECWGGATFDASLRFLHEDPWMRLRKLRDGFKNTKLQMLFRGQNILGYRPYADDVVEYFVQKSIANGIDIIRIFDCMNDLRNLQTAVKAANKEKAHAQIALCYTLGDAYTLDYWTDLAKRIVFVNAGGSDYYQSKLDPVLDDPSNELYPDMMGLEVDYVQKYVNSDWVQNVADLGITADDYANSYQYNLDLGSDVDGNVRALFWQATPGCYAVRADLAEKYLGTTDPAALAEKFKDLDTIVATAKEVNDASGGKCKLFSGYDEIKRSLTGSRTQGFYDENDVITIDDNIKTYMETAKTLYDEDLTFNTDQWSADWSANMSGDGVDSNAALAYMGCPWFVYWSLSDAWKGNTILVPTQTKCYWGGTGLAATTDCADTELAAKIMKFFTCDEDGMVAINALNSDYVNNTAAVSKIIEAGTSADGNGYLYPDAGQNFMEFFLPLADGLDASMVTAEDQQILSLMDTQTKAYATGEKDLDTALADLTASIHDTFSYLSAE